MVHFSSFLNITSVVFACMFGRALFMPEMVFLEKFCAH